MGVDKTTCIGLTSIFPACIVISQQYRSRVSGIVATIVSLVMIGFGGNLVITALMAEYGHIAQEVEAPRRPEVAVANGVVARSYGIFTTTLAVAMFIASLTAQAVVNSRGWSTLYVGLALLTILLDLILLCRLKVGGTTPIWRRVLRIRDFQI